MSDNSERLRQGFVEHRELLGEVKSQLAAVVALQLTERGDLRLKSCLLVGKPGQCRAALAVEVGGCSALVRASSAATWSASLRLAARITSALA